MSDRLRVAVAGTGMIGRIHARSARLAGAELVGVAASSPQRSRAAAERLRAARAFDTAEDLVVSDDVDVVHICTPNYLHAPLTRLALEAGKHVVCEKPLTTTVAEAVELLELARSAERVAAVPFVYRFYPTVRDARARVRADDLGRLRVLHGSYLQDWLTHEDDYNWRVDPDLGGRSRAFGDIGSHWCDLVEFVSGQRIVRLTARTATVLDTRVRSEHTEAFTTGRGQGAREQVATEDVATVLFETDGGAVGSVVISQVSPGRKNRLWFELDGARASLAFDQEHPELLWRGERDGVRLIPRDAGDFDPASAPYATIPAGHPQGYHDCFELFVRDVYEAVQNGTPDGLPTFDDGVRAARLTDAVLEAAASERWVEVPQ